MTQAERLQALKESRDPTARMARYLNDRAMAEAIAKMDITKGEKGDTGEKGDSIVGPQGIQGKQGERGLQGKPGDTGPRGPAGDDGKDGKDGRNGKDALPVQPQTIIDAVLKELAAGLTLEPKHIKGLGDKIKNLDDLIAFLKAGGFRGGAGTPAVAGGAPFAETVSGLINSVNKTFTVPTTIVAAQALYLANSVYQPVVDFSVSGTTITMTVAPDISLAGQPMWLLHT